MQGVEVCGAILAPLLGAPERSGDALPSRPRRPRQASREDFEQAIAGEGGPGPSGLLAPERARVKTAQGGRILKGQAGEQSGIDEALAAGLPEGEQRREALQTGAGAVTHRRRSDR